MLVDDFLAHFFCFFLVFLLNLFEVLKSSNYILLIMLFDQFFELLPSQGILYYK